MTIYGHLTPNNSAELKPWDMVHVDLIVPYINSIIQHQPGSAIIRNNAILTWRIMVDPTTGWFNIVEIPT